MLRLQWDIFLFTKSFLFYHFKKMPANFFHFIAITWFLRDFCSRSEYLSKCLLDFLNWSFCFPCLGSLILRPRQTSISAMLYLLPEGRWAHSPQISYQAHDNLTPDLSLTPPAPNATLSPFPPQRAWLSLLVGLFPRPCHRHKERKCIALLPPGSLSCHQKVWQNSWIPLLA